MWVSSILRPSDIIGGFTPKLFELHKTPLWWKIFAFAWKVSKSNSHIWERYLLQQPLYQQGKIERQYTIWKGYEYFEKRKPDFFRVFPLKYKGWLPNAKLKKYKKELSHLGATWVSWYPTHIDPITQLAPKSNNVNKQKVKIFQPTLGIHAMTTHVH